MRGEVRVATMADLPAITAIYGYHVEHGLASFEETVPDLEEMTRRFKSVRAAGYPWLVAVSGTDDVVGYSYAASYRSRPAYRFSVENTVYVSPDALGGGLGRLLLGTLIEECEVRGYRQMIAVIGDRENHASIGLHKAMGFEHAGTLSSVGFKHGRWVDSVLMQRALGPGDSADPEPPNQRDA